MEFLVPNCSCLQKTLTRGLPPPDPSSICPLSSTEFVEPPPPNKIPGYATGLKLIEYCRIWYTLVTLLGNEVS